MSYIPGVIWQGEVLRYVHVAAVFVLVSRCDVYYQTSTSFGVWFALITKSMTLYILILTYVHDVHVMTAT